MRRMHVTLPDDIVAAIDAVAQRSGESRNALMVRAIEEFCERADPEGVTRQLNEVYADPSAVAETLALAANGKRAFQRTMDN